MEMPVSRADRVLGTGVAGFIGRDLVDHLLERRDRVTDRRRRPA